MSSVRVVRSFSSLSARTYLGGLARNLCAGYNPAKQPLAGRVHGQKHCYSSSSESLLGAVPVTKDISDDPEDPLNSWPPVDSTKPKFSSYPLDREILAKLAELGFEDPFEIQAETLPHTLNGKDVIGRAVTGSGKTLAYALPIIHALSKSESSDNPRALVITPTRELCSQVHKSIQSLNKKIRCVALYGGTSYYSQENDLQYGVDVVCATPGRLNDHLIKRRSFSLEDIKFLILDEADELLTPNFKAQIEHILDDAPKDKQMMLFSATMPRDIKSLTRRYMKDAIMVDLVSNRSLVPEGIVHQYVTTRPSNKFNVVPDLLLSEQPRRALVFTSTKVATHVLATQLSNLGFKASALNSDMSQQSRDACFASFKSGAIEVLVATDVAARGLDVPELDLVIQVDIPPNGVDFYIHRSGRTGRKGQAGKTILVSSWKTHAGASLDSFLRDLEEARIPMEPAKLPTPNGVANSMVKKVVSELDPAKMHQGAMEVARPYTQQLIDQHGASEALAAALVAISNLGSKFEQEEERDTRDDRFGEDRRPRSRRDRDFGRGRYNDSFDSYGDNRRGGFGDDRRGGFDSDRRRSFGGDKRGVFGSDRRGGYRDDRRGGYGGDRRGGYGSQDYEVDDYESPRRRGRGGRSSSSSMWSGDRADDVFSSKSSNAAAADNFEDSFNWDEFEENK